MSDETPLAENPLDGQPVWLAARELERLNKKERVEKFLALDGERALPIFQYFDPAIQWELLRSIPDGATVTLLAQMDPDDRAALLEELPAKTATKLLQGLSTEERDMTAELLGYPADSVGRKMSPEFVPIPQHFTVDQALTRVKSRVEGAETVYLLPVVGKKRELVGAVSLRRLLMNEPDTIVQEIMNPPISIQANADKEEAAKLVREEGLIALPIVNSENGIVGILTVDDAMNILEEEESEDTARAGASEPLRRPYLTTPIRGLVASRIGWLLVLILAATLTVNVLSYFENTLAEVVSLALFVPLLIGTGGNAGAQAATTVIRAMSVMDVRFQDLPRVVGKEIIAGFSLGALLGFVGFIPAGLLVGWPIASVLSSALVIVCTLATLVGSLIPLIAQRVGIDPAVVSAPFITTIVDTTGLIVYFLIARAILGL